MVDFHHYINKAMEELAIKQDQLQINSTTELTMPTSGLR
jgi:hypothetical protein